MHTKNWIHTQTHTHTHTHTHTAEMKWNKNEKGSWNETYSLKQIKILSFIDTNAKVLSMVNGNYSSKNIFCIKILVFPSILKALEHFCCKLKLKVLRKLHLFMPHYSYKKIYFCYLFYNVEQIRKIFSDNTYV